MLRKVLAYYTLLVYDLEFTTPYWSMTSSLLHLKIHQCTIVHTVHALASERPPLYTTPEHN